MDTIEVKEKVEVELLLQENVTTNLDVSTKEEGTEINGTTETKKNEIEVPETKENEIEEIDTTEERIFAFIVNPQSGAGRGKQFSDVLQERLTTNFTRKKITWHIYFTEASGDGIKLAQFAIREGYNYIVSVGGDGTHNEVLNGIISHDISVPVENRKKIVMGIIPLGTGGDFQRTLGTSNFSPDTYIQMLFNPKKYKSKPQLIDVGHIECTPLAADNRPGTLNERYFLNISSSGVSAAVCHGANTSSKKLGGFTTFFYQTCKQTLLWKNKPTRWKIDDSDDWSTGTLYQLVIANGQFYGGGMKVAPTARLDSGKFEIITFHDIGVLDVAMLPKIYRGTHLDNKKIQHVNGSKIFAEINEEDASDFEMLIEADGEIVGKLPATWTVFPQSLWLLHPEIEYDENASPQIPRVAQSPIMSPRSSSPVHSGVNEPATSPLGESPARASPLSQSPQSSKSSENNV